MGRRINTGKHPNRDWRGDPATRDMTTPPYPPSSPLFLFDQLQLGLSNHDVHPMFDLVTFEIDLLLQVKPHLPIDK